MGSYNVEISSHDKFSIMQNTNFQHKNHKIEKVVIGLVQKGNTISDLKSTKSMGVEDETIKGMKSFNLFYNEGMLATQLSRYQERPFNLYNIHQSHENLCIYNGSFLFHHQLKESSDIYMRGFTKISKLRTTYL